MGHRIQAAAVAAPPARKRAPEVAVPAVALGEGATSVVGSLVPASSAVVAPAAPLAAVATTSAPTEEKATETTEAATVQTPVPPLVQAPFPSVPALLQAKVEVPKATLVATALRT